MVLTRVQRKPRPLAACSISSFAQARFSQLGLCPLAFQKEVWQAMEEKACGLIHAPTGFGKTYAVWAGVLGQLLLLWKALQ